MDKKESLYESVTKQIIEKLESGVMPWEQGWSANQPAFKLPVRSTGEHYKGINTLILWMKAIDKDYRSHTWCSFKHAKDQGWSVRKGEKATHVAYYSTFEVEVEGKDETKNIPFLKTFPVFNYDQIDGAPVPETAPIRVVRNGGERIRTCEEFAQNTGARIEERGNRACFVPSTDMILMPRFDDFKSPDHYYRTLFHELTHWTGPKLEREFGKRFGDQKYAREEIVAELGSAFLSSDFELSGVVDRSSAYIDSWLSVLKKDSKAIFTLASCASKAVDFLKSFQESGEVAKAA